MNRSGALAFLAGAASAAITFLAFQRFSSTKSKVEDSESVKIDVPEDIKRELLSRIISFFGEEKFSKIKNAHVIVVGLGGVGSHCANMLVRSGVGKIKLIDFDQVSLSSLNRHAVGTLSDVGTSKAETLKRRLLSVIPWCDITACAEMFKASDAERLISGKPDFVLDCIDDVNTKGELIAFCVKNNIPVLTSMGAGGKVDPTKLRIAPLSDCVNDPLASKIKWKLKKHGVSADKVISIFSIEKPVVELLPLTDEQAATPQEFGAVDYLRVRVIPVLGTSPSIFGQAMASYALCSLAGMMYDPEGFEILSKHLKHKIRTQFKKNEKERYGTDADIEMDDDDVEFIVQTMWRSRCAITGKRFFGPSTLTLTRWHADQPADPWNLVLMVHAQAQLLIKAQREGNNKMDDIFPKDVVEKIENRLRWSKAVCAGDLKTIDTNSSAHNDLSSQWTAVPFSYNANVSPLQNETWDPVNGYCLTSVSKALVKSRPQHRDRSVELKTLAISSMFFLSSLFVANV